MEKKIILKSLVFIFMMFAGLFTALASQAQSGNINLSFKNAEIKTVLNSIRTQTGYDFVYNADEIENNRRISVEVKNSDLQTALKQCFHSSNIIFSALYDFVWVNKKSPTFASWIQSNYLHWHWV